MCYVPFLTGKWIFKKSTEIPKLLFLSSCSGYSKLRLQLIREPGYISRESNVISIWIMGFLFYYLGSGWNKFFLFCCVCWLVREYLWNSSYWWCPPAYHIGRGIVTSSVANKCGKQAGQGRTCRKGPWVTMFRLIWFRGSPDFSGHLKLCKKPSFSWNWTSWKIKC